MFSLSFPMRAFVLLLCLLATGNGLRMQATKPQARNDPGAQSLAQLNQEAPTLRRLRRPMAAIATLLMMVDPTAAGATTAPTQTAPAQTQPRGPWKSEMSFTDQMLAGAGARSSTQTLLHPIDVMRTRIQAKGITSALRPRTFLKGIAPVPTLAIPAGALQFGAYEWAKDQFAKAKMSGAGPEVISGAIGALAASTIRVPQEVLKQRVQADIYPNALSGFKTLMKTEGPRGFYKGGLAQISRDVPFNALSFMFFGQAKKSFNKIAGRAPDTQENLCLGALSGMTAAVIMTPIDVVKTRLMTGGASGGIAGTFASILEKEGASTLMKGVVPRVCYLAPFAAATFTFYDFYGKQIVSSKTGVPVKDLK